MLLRRLILTGFITALLAGAVPADGGEPQDQPTSRKYYCRLSHLATVMKFDDAPIAIENDAVAFTEDGVSWPSFSIRNRAQLPIEALALVVEYRDHEGKVIDRVPVYAVSDAARDQLHFPFHPIHTFNWKGVAPGAVSSINAANDGVRVGNCPTEAEITFLVVGFVNGDVRTLSSPGWRLGPIPKFIPPISTPLVDMIHVPVALLTKVRVNSLGLVTDIVPANPGDEMPTSMYTWIQQKWRFHPALLNGTPTDSELNVLFQFYAERISNFPETQPISSPVTLVRIFPKVDKSRGWEVHFGSLEEFSTVQ